MKYICGKICTCITQNIQRERKIERQRERDHLTCTSCPGFGSEGQVEKTKTRE